MSLLKISRRPSAKAKTIVLVCGTLLIIWFFFLGNDNTQSSSSKSSQSSFEHSLLSRENYDKLFHPLRRSPVPSAGILLFHGAKDEENAGKEIEDVGKQVIPAVHDENTAVEEHSGQKASNSFSDIKKIPFQETVGKYSKESEDPESFHHLQEFKEEVVDYRYMKDVKNDIITKLKPVKTSKKEVPDEESFHQLPEHQKELPDDKYGSYNNWRNLSLPDIKKLSNLGKRLFLNEKVGTEANKKFKIHVWKYYRYIENRLIKRYTGKNVDPFEDCSVNNCEITYNDSKYEEADAVIFHLHRIQGPPSNLKRSPNQIWIWMSDESPYNMFMQSRNKNLQNYKGLFNMSMTYRMNSDIPVPYGRTVPIPKDQYLDKIEDIYSQNKKGIAIMSSNCGGDRFSYVEELQKYINVDVYGRCGPLKCPGHYNKDCALINDYKFYLAFENSHCDDYITEKVWWNSFHKGSVPVVMGPSKESYSRLLPPDSFIHVDDFDGPQHLAQYLEKLLEDKNSYNTYHHWRTKFKVLNEHGYFQSPVYHFCRACEALNYNDMNNVDNHEDIDKFFDISTHCYTPKWRSK